MTQQLTREQLKFARSIGATRYLKDGIWTDELTAAFFYTDDSVWSGGHWVPSRRAAGDDDYPIIDFSPLDELEPEYVPKAGEWCLSSGGAQMFYIGKNSDGDGVFQLENGGLTCFDSLSGFRPLPDPEQQRRDELLEKWRSQGLDYAHDTEHSQVSLARVFDFIVDMGDCCNSSDEKVAGRDKWVSIMCGGIPEGTYHTSKIKQALIGRVDFAIENGYRLMEGE